MTRAVPTSLVLACLMAALPAQAQAPTLTWPTRPIELIVPWTPGAGVDIMARAVAQAMTEHLGQNVYVTNREGAGGTIGFRQLVTSPPDGYMLGGGPATPITNSPYLVKGVHYDAGSFEYICQVFENVFALAVNASSKYPDAKSFIAAAAASPVKLSYGSAGVGSIPHLSVENMAEALKLNVQHVPFRGDAALLPVLIKGDLDFAAVGVSSIRGQNVRPLVVFADQRHPALPDVPSTRDLGMTTNVPPGLNGIFAPKGLPAPVREALDRACAAAVRHHAVTQAAQNTGVSISYLTGEQFRARITEDYRFKGELIRRLGLESQ